MNKSWEQIVITKIALAMYVQPGSGRAVHTDRPYHGLVLNDEGVEKDYHFSDGRVLHTKGGSLFYLPKGATYEVRSVCPGGCYAINFEAELWDEPFVFSVKNRDRLSKSFRTAAEEWKRDFGHGRICALRALYDAIYCLCKEERDYVSRETADKIAPALELLDTRFTDSTLTVEELAQSCQMSQVYLRRIFQNRFGVSPKEYLIRKRLQYAGQLLQSGQFGVGEVAKLCGYTEPCHFSREFSARVGVPPRGFGMQTGAMDNLDRK